MSNANTIAIIPGHTYGVESLDGYRVTSQLSADEALQGAQTMADEYGEDMYLYDEAVAGDAQLVRCSAADA